MQFLTISLASMAIFSGFVLASDHFKLECKTPQFLEICKEGFEHCEMNGEFEAVPYWKQGFTRRGTCESKKDADCKCVDTAPPPTFEDSACDKLIDPKKVKPGQKVYKKGSKGCIIA